MDIKITAIAGEKIKEELKKVDGNLMVRIYVEAVACSRAKFGIAFDELKDGDEITEVDGIKIVTDTQYIPKYSEGISIDYVTGEREGFIIKSLNVVSGGCSGGCSSGCSGCHKK